MECNEDNKLVGKRLSTANDDKVTVCLADVIDAINKHNKGKSPGPEGLQSEAYMYGGLRLATYLCLLLNLFFLHSFVPDSFITARSYASAVLAMALCLSVCLSVTSRCSTKTAKRRITQTTPHDSPGTLVF